MFDGATPKIKSDAEIASFEAVLDVQLDNDLYDDGLVDACSIRPGAPASVRRAAWAALRATLGAHVPALSFAEKRLVRQQDAESRAREITKQLISAVIFIHGQGGITQVDSIQIGNDRCDDQG